MKGTVLSSSECKNRSRANGGGSGAIVCTKQSERVNEEQMCIHEVRGRKRREGVVFHKICKKADTRYLKKKDVAFSLVDGLDFSISQRHGRLLPGCSKRGGARQRKKLLGTRRSQRMGMPQGLKLARAKFLGCHLWWLGFRVTPAMAAVLLADYVAARECCFEKTHMKHRKRDAGRLFLY